MPDSTWLGKPGQIETCRVCSLTFALYPGESTSALIHRYTAWREAHAHLPETEIVTQEEAP